MGKGLVEEEVAVGGEEEEGMEGAEGVGVVLVEFHLSPSYHSRPNSP